MESIHAIYDHVIDGCNEHGGHGHVPHAHHRNQDEQNAADDDSPSARFAKAMAQQKKLEPMN
jgi:hypothetical protein